MSRRAFDAPTARPAHRYSWLWEPLESDPTFVVRAMFGGKAAYLDGRLALCFFAKADPWRGVLVSTERALHASLQTEFPSLAPHPVLPKWLYLSESCEDFEAVAQRLVSLAARRDPRIGVPGQIRQRRRESSGPKVRRGTRA